MPAHPVKRILICAALPRELKYILKRFPGWRKELPHPGAVLSFESESGELLLLRTGVGIQRSELSLRSALCLYRPDLIVSLGFAGAIYEGLSSGDMVWASRVLLLSEKTPAGGIELSEISLAASRNLADRLGGRLSLREGCIVTLKHFMRKPEIIRNLPGGLLFPVCDMETFILAKTAAEQAIPFFAVRAVTDTSGQEIPPELLDISDESGRTRILVLLMRVLSKPSLSRHVVALRKSSLMAAGNLASLVSAIADNRL